MPGFLKLTAQSFEPVVYLLDIAGSDIADIGHEVGNLIDNQYQARKIEL